MFVLVLVIILEAREYEVFNYEHEYRFAEREHGKGTGKLVFSSFVVPAERRGERLLIKPDRQENRIRHGSLSR